MKFTVAGNKIICSRNSNTAENANNFRQIVAFDAHLESVPPHVAAKLTKREILELEHFLDDRKRIQASPTKDNMLEALPNLLAETSDALSSVDELDRPLYLRLCSSVADLTAALQSVRPRSKGRVTPIRGMRESEALKERLEDIRQNL
jgi:hypothetical protein